MFMSFAPWTALQLPCRRSQVWDATVETIWRFCGTGTPQLASCVGVGLNSAMKPGITAKLFIAVLATGILITLAMGIAAHISFTRGFLGYLNEQGIERAESLLPALSTAYREHGDWDFLRHNPRAWFEDRKSVV